MPHCEKNLFVKAGFILFVSFFCFHCKEEKETPDVSATAIKNDEKIVNTVATLGTSDLKQDPPLNQTTKQLGASEPKNRPNFRDIFNSYALNAYNYTEEQAQELLYPPSPEMLTLWEDSKITSTEPLTDIRQVLKTLKPSDLYLNGKNVAWKKQTVKDLQATFSKTGPITLLLFNGIMSENLASPGWNDVFEEKSSSSLAKKFAKKMEENKHNEKSVDTVYSIGKEGPDLHPLSDNVKMASFDDEQGNPLINVILLQPLPGSMESFSTIEENVSEFIRRINKVFVLLNDIPQNIFLIGYSRGTPIALELLTEARKRSTEIPWALKIKGIISYAGVSFGSDLADDAFPSQTKTNAEKSPMQRLAETLIQLENELEPVDPKDTPLIKSKKVVANEKALVSAQTYLLKYKVGPFPPDFKKNNPGLEKENLHTQLPNFSFMMQSANIFLNNTLEMNRPFSEYSSNISRFKDILRRIEAASVGLSTQKRMDWWKTHQIPDDIKLISLPTTMYDITTASQEPSPMLFKNYLVDYTSTDYGVTRTSYYQMWNLSGLQLNDGAVPLDRCVMWPRMVKFFNPKFPLENIYFAGIHSANHMAIAIPSGIKSADEKNDPFPRSLIIRSLGTFASQILDAK